MTFRSPAATAPALPPCRHGVRGPAHAAAAALVAVLLSTGTALAASDAPTDFEILPVPPRQYSSVHPAPKFQYLFGEPARWRGPILWKYNHANAPPPWDADPVGTLNAITATLVPWTQVCGITFSYQGETTIVPNTRPPSPYGGTGPDYETVVGWDTLADRIAGITYVWLGTTTLGERILLDTDIILSVDAVRSAQQMTRVATHEWGHALGLSHSNLGDAIMSGPPDTAYNGLQSLQPDDVRGCRCLYGPAAGQAAGYSCSLPKKVDFGIVPLGAESPSRTISFSNDGNAAITVNGAFGDTPEIVKDVGCPAGTVLQRGQSCAVQVSVRPSLVGPRVLDFTFNTSDGRYRVPVNFEGSVAAPAPTVVSLVEYFHAGFGHYFVTHLAEEITRLDNGTLAGWTRTGKSWKAWSQPGTGTAPVCRFFSEAFAPKSSHFYTSFDFECAKVKANRDWTFEGEVFHVQLPAPADGTCAAGLAPVYRLYNESRDGVPNHRFTTDPVLQREMIAQGWTAEGYGPGVTMCVPQ